MAKGGWVLIRSGSDARLEHWPGSREAIFAKLRARDADGSHVHDVIDRQVFWTKAGAEQTLHARRNPEA